jgi:hypothetical protein
MSHGGVKRDGPGDGCGESGLHTQSAYTVFMLEFMHLRDQLMHGRVARMSRSEASHLKRKQLRPCPVAAV